MDGYPDGKSRRSEDARATEGPCVRGFVLDEADAETVWMVTQSAWQKNPWFQVYAFIK